MKLKSKLSPRPWDDPAPYPPEFERDYEIHLKRLTLNRMRPKTIEAYSMALRSIAHYFSHQINDLSKAQLTEYFSSCRVY